MAGEAVRGQGRNPSGRTPPSTPVHAFQSALRTARHSRKLPYRHDRSVVRTAHDSRLALPRQQPHRTSARPLREELAGDAGELEDATGEIVEGDSRHESFDP